MADASLATGQREAEKAYEEGVERVRTTTACHKTACHNNKRRRAVTQRVSGV